MGIVSLSPETMTPRKFISTVCQPVSSKYDPQGGMWVLSACLQKLRPQGGMWYRQPVSRNYDSKEVCGYCQLVPRELPRRYDSKGVMWVCGYCQPVSRNYDPKGVCGCCQPVPKELPRKYDPNGVCVGTVTLSPENYQESMTPRGYVWVLSACPQRTTQKV